MSFTPRRPSDPSPDRRPDGRSENEDADAATGADRDPADDGATARTTGDTPAVAHDPRRPGAGKRRRRIAAALGRPGRVAMVAALVAVIALATSVLVLRQDSTVRAGVPDGTELSATGRLVVTRDGTTIDARDVSGPIYVKADDVTIRRTRVHYGGDYLIRIYSGYMGTVVEDSDLICPNDTKGNALAFGHYTARRVRVTGCKTAFLSTGGDITVEDSLWNGESVSRSVGPNEVPSTTAAPTTTAPPTTAAPTTAPPTTAAPTTAPPTTATAEARDGTFPGASNTGVPDGVSLTPTGSMTVTDDGAVIDGQHITGTVTIDANDVTIRNTLISNTGTYPIRLINGARNLVVEDTEIDGGGQGNVAILSGNYTLRRVDIHGTLDGPRIEGDDVLIEDSYIHHLHRVPDGHHDIIQIRSGQDIQIRNNRLEAYNPETDDPMNAVIQIGSLNGTLSGLVVEGNFMNGGNYTVNAVKNGSNTAIFRNNTFGDDARYGPLASGGALEWGANTFTNGAPAD